MMEQKYRMTSTEKILSCGSLLVVISISIIAMILVIKFKLGIAFIGITIIVSILCIGTVINFFGHRIAQKEANLRKEK